MNPDDDDDDDADDGGWEWFFGLASDAVVASLCPQQPP